MHEFPDPFYSIPGTQKIDKCNRNNPNAILHGFSGLADAQFFSKNHFNPFLI